MKKILFTLILVGIISLQLSAKEVFILVDASTKLEKKDTQKSLIKILSFSKKKLDKNYLKYDDTVSSFFMTGKAENLTIKPFSDFQLIESKKSRKKLTKKAKKMLKVISKLSANEIPKMFTIPTVDIVFCMDASGSMMEKGGANYKQAKKIALDLISSIKSKKTRIAIVTFSENAKVYQGFTSDKNKLKKSFEKININGSTNATSGLKKANNLLKKSEAEIKKIIFLSDGLPNNKNNAIAMANTIHTKKIDLVTVALKGADIKLLDKLSSTNITLNAENISLDTIKESIKGVPSPILESIYYMSNQWSPSIKERKLIIFSSMMQKSDEYSFYAEKEVQSSVTINKILSDLKSRDMLPNLTGTTVYIQGLSNVVGPKKNGEIKIFWEAYFKACGAKLSSWGPAINLKS